MPKYLGVGRYTSDGLNGLARESVLRCRAEIAKMIESAAFGTKRTSRHAQSMSAFGEEADIECRRAIKLFLAAPCRGLLSALTAFAFASVLLALPYKARFGGAVKRFTFRAHGLAFAGLCHSGADKA